MLAQALVEKGSTLATMGRSDDDESVPLLRRAYAMAHEIGDHLLCARATYNLADSVRDFDERRQIIELSRAAALTAEHMRFAHHGIEVKFAHCNRQTSTLRVVTRTQR